MSKVEIKEVTCLTFKGEDFREAIAALHEYLRNKTLLCPSISCARTTEGDYLIEVTVSPNGILEDKVSSNS